MQKKIILLLQIGYFINFYREMDEDGNAIPGTSRDTIPKITSLRTR